MEFRKFNGESVGDVIEYVRNYIDSHDKSEFIVMVGCDSLPFGLRKRKATFVEVICLYERLDGMGRGAHVIFRRENRVRVIDTRDRLMKEAYRLVEICSLLKNAGIEKHPRVQGVEPQLDFNKKEGEESYKYLAEATGFVRAMGFEVQVKPDAPAASYAADHCCRRKERAV